VLLFALLPGRAYAQEENRAALVVVYGDGTVAQKCVAFAEESVSGYDLLLRSGLPSRVEASAIGPTVCSIGGEGCDFPQESCFCRCQGSPCIYWSYWRLQEDGAWRYQTLGAGNTHVRNGDVEGWRWAEGTTRAAQAPPDATFDAICGPAAANVPPPASGLTTTVSAGAADPSSAASAAETMTAAIASSPVVSAGIAGVSGQTGVALAPAENPAVNAAAGAQPEASATGGLWLLLGGVIVIPAAVLVVWALVRGGRKPSGA
jgi:hypothetical protein